jgi:hypothetical protein
VATDNTITPGFGVTFTEDDGSVAKLDRITPAHLARFSDRRSLRIMRALVALSLDTIDAAIKIKDAAEEGT